MDYLAIQDFPPAKRIYQDCVSKSELEPKITHFNEEFKKLDLDNPTPEAGQRAAELLRVAEEYKASLIKVRVELFSLSANTRTTTKFWQTIARRR